MAWARIIGQERVCRLLDRVCDTGRVAHAYLFTGPEGCGKQALAVEFAAALQEGKAGGEVNSHAGEKVRRMIHPDVHVLLPTPRDVDPAIYGKRLEEMAADPYAAVDFVRRPVSGKKGGNPKSAFYPVDRIRNDVILRARFKPTEGNFQIFIIIAAESMRKESANAFLKLLEEPPEQTIFLLTTNREDRLLPTLVSRCQRIRLDGLEASEIETALKKRFPDVEKNVELFARMSDGSYSRAVELLFGMDLDSDRELIIGFLRAAWAQSIFSLSDYIDTFASRSRDETRQLLDLFTVWLRDLLIWRTSQDASRIVNVDRVEDLQRFCDGLPGARLEAMMQVVRDARLLLDRNVNASLIFRSLQYSMYEAMHGKADRSLVPDLADV